MKKQTKKIAIVVTSVLMVKFFLVPQITALSKKYDVTLILKNDFPEILSELNITTRIIEIPIERKISVLKDFITLLNLICILRKNKFDMVHTLTPKAGLLGMMASWITRVPVRIHTFQGEVWYTKTGVYRLILKFMDFIVGVLATKLTVVSATERKFLIGERVIRSDKSMVLANGSICGVNLKKFTPSSINRKTIRSNFEINVNDVVFLYVGRLNPDKGILELFNAFRKITRVRDNVKLLLVGVDEDHYLEKLLNENSGLKNKIISVGYSSTPEKYMQASDVLMLPSHREGFGMVVIEAAAVGIPSVGSDIYGIQDAIDNGVTGLLFKRGNVDSLVDNMIVLIDSPVNRKLMGDNARKRVELMFSESLVVNSMLDFYNKSLN